MNKRRPDQTPKSKPFANRPKTRAALISRARNCSPRRKARCKEHGIVQALIVGGIAYCPEQDCKRRTTGNRKRPDRA